MQIEATLEQHRPSLATEVMRQRAATQHTTHRMTVMAVRQWEHAARGILAIPSAIALTTAASAMFVTTVVERTFEVVELAVVQIGRGFGSDSSVDDTAGRGVPRSGDERRNEPS